MRQNLADKKGERQRAPFNLIGVSLIKYETKWFIFVCLIIVAQYIETRLCITEAGMSNAVKTGTHIQSRRPDEINQRNSALHNWSMQNVMKSNLFVSIKCMHAS